MSITKPLSCRVMNEDFARIENIAKDKGFKVGTYLREIMPFILSHSELLNMDKPILLAFQKLISNRNILARNYGEQLTKGELDDIGFDFSKFTGVTVEGIKRKIHVLDFLLEEQSTNNFIITRVENGTL